MKTNLRSRIQLICMVSLFNGAGVLIAVGVLSYCPENWRKILFAWFSDLVF